VAELIGRAPGYTAHTVA